MKSVFKILTLSTLLFAGQGAFSDTPVQSEIRLDVDKTWQREGDTTTHRFRQPTYVERILVSAEGYRGYTTIDVYADSDRVGVMGVPGRDPDFPIVIRKTVSTISFRFGGSAKINDARAWVDFGGDYQSPGFGLGYYNNQNPQSLRTNQDVARAVLSVVAQLQINIMEDDFKTYLLPMRSAAIRLAASAGARPPLADKTQSRAYALKMAIDKAEPFLQKLENNQVYVRAIELLLEVSERIESNYEG